MDVSFDQWTLPIKAFVLVPVVQSIEAVVSNLPNPASHIDESALKKSLSVHFADDIPSIV